MAVGDLTTIDAVRALLQKEQADEGFDDDLIADLISAASRQITRWTRREFVQPGYDPAAVDPRGDERPSARTFRSRGCILDLDPYDLREIEAIANVSDGAPGTAITRYEEHPLPASDGVYTWMEIPGLRDGAKVQVTGLWGWPAIPEDVAMWCARVVVEWLRSGVAAYSTAFLVDEGRLDRPEALPHAAMRALAYLRRTVV